MRVNSQNLFRSIYFFICMTFIVFSFCAHAQVENSENFDLLQKYAEQGDASSQYFLGMLYKEGTAIDGNPMLAYIWLSLAAKQKYEDADTQRDIVYSELHKNYRSSAKAMVDQYYEKYVIPFIPEFEINLNGKKITESSDVSPDMPIYAIFTHIDPNVKHVRMHYPKKPSRFKTFELGIPHRILNHEKFMKANRKSRSVFLALGEDGTVYSKIVITFIPVSQEPVSKEEVGQKEDENSQ